MKMGGKDTLGALPLLCCSWSLVQLNLPHLEARNGIYDGPGNTTTKVDNLHDRKWTFSNAPSINTHQGLTLWSRKLMRPIAMMGSRSKGTKQPMAVLASSACWCWYVHRAAQPSRGQQQPLSHWGWESWGTHTQYSLPITVTGTTNQHLREIVPISGVGIEHQSVNVESIRRHGMQGFSGPQPIPNIPNDPWSHNWTSIWECWKHSKTWYARI